MPKVALPKFRVHAARRQFCVDVPRVGQRAQRVYLGRDEAAARAEYDRIVMPMLHGRPPALEVKADANKEAPAPAKVVRVVKVLADYIRYLRARQPTTHGHYVHEDHVGPMARLVRDVIGFEEAATLKSTQIEKAFDAMVRQGWALATIRKRTLAFRNVIKRAVKDEVLPERVIAAFDLADRVDECTKGVKQALKRRPADLADVRRTQEHCTQSVRDMIELMVVTGCRPTEVFRMRAVDIDTAGPVWKYTPVTHKTQHHGKTRVIYIGPKGQQVLARYFGRGRVDLPVFSPKLSEVERREAMHAARTTRLSCGNRPGTHRKASPERTPGTAWNGSSFGHAIEAAQTRAGIETKWCAYQIRHLSLTAFRAAGSLDATAVLAGHSSTKITDEIYAQRDEAKALELVARVG